MTDLEDTLEDVALDVGVMDAYRAASHLLSVENQVVMLTAGLMSVLSNHGMDAT